MTKFTPVQQSGTTAWMVTGSIVGALAAGVPGAIVGGIIGTIFDEFKLCPRCKGVMRPTSNDMNVWQCSKCGHWERKI